ncbi:MAG: Fe-S cluster assembly protein SufD [Candidatus Krumholzibacteriia bacterium]
MADNFDIKRFAKLEAETPRTGPKWLAGLRASARDGLIRHGFPTTRTEGWRFTRLRPLLSRDFCLEKQYHPNGLSTADVAGLTFDDTDCRRLVLVSGNPAQGLSAVGRLPEGVHVESLAEALRSRPALVRKYLARHACPEKNPFVALNTAHMLDGAFVHIPEGITLEEPIHLLCVSASRDGSTMSHPRNLIVAEAGSRATIIESYVAPGDDIYYTNPVTEIIVGQGAAVDHYKLQKESPASYHTATLQAHLDRGSCFHTDFLSSGGELVRNDVNTYLDGEGIECTLNGLYVARGHQHVDNNTNIDHAMPNCNSYELYKGILTDRARAVFNGKIHVHPDAQKTDAKQSNGCMLLSDDAQINTNPQLEIYADDVKCTHGAVVGQIDDNAVFYLRSRGIDEVSARNMLIHAFAGEVIEQVKVAPLRERLAGDLKTWLAGAITAGDA